MRFSISNGIKIVLKLTREKLTKEFKLFFWSGGSSIFYFFIIDDEKSIIEL